MTPFISKNIFKLKRISKKKRKETIETFPRSMLFSNTSKCCLHTASIEIQVIKVEWGSFFTKERVDLVSLEYLIQWWWWCDGNMPNPILSVFIFCWCRSIRNHLFTEQYEPFTWARIVIPDLKRWFRANTLMSSNRTPRACYYILRQRTVFSL